MAGRILQFARRYLVSPPAYSLLVDDDARLAQRQPACFGRAWPMLLALSFAWGGVCCGAWWLCGLLLGGMSVGLEVAPLVLTAGFVLWLYRRGVCAVADAIAPSDATTRASAVAVMTLALWVCYRALHMNMWPTDSEQLPAWLLPQDIVYRVLLLAPLWGGWAMIVAPKFRRLSPGAEPAVAAFAGGCGPLASSLVMAIPLALSLLFFNFFGWWQAIIPGATILCAVLAAAGLGWRGGLTRRGLLAANVLTQVVFLLAYLVTRNLAV